MLHKIDIHKINKPFIVILITKALLFLSIIIFLSSTNNSGFDSSNPDISSCSIYLNYKYSNYFNLIRTSEFIMSIVGTFFSFLNVIAYLSYLFSNKIQQKQMGKQQQKYTKNRLSYQFLFNFTEFLTAINIFSRSIEIIRQSQSCQQLYSNNNIGLIILSTLLFILLISSTFVLFKILAMIMQKLQNQNYMNQLSEYTQSSSIRANLLYNKQGYMKDLLNLQNYSSKTTQLKQQTIKHFPSGIKKNTILDTRQIVHRLRGGRKPVKAPKKLNFSQDKITEEQEDVQISFQKQIYQQMTPSNKINTDQQNNMFGLFPVIQKTQQLYKQNPNQFLQIDQKNLLNVKPPLFKLNPNEQNRTGIESTLNVLSFTIKNKKMRQQLRSQRERKQLQSPKHQNHDPSNILLNLNQSVFKIKKNSQDKNEAQKNKPKLSLQQLQQLELKRNYNLAHESQMRNLMAKRRNYQNIDQNGNYFYIDMNIIDKKDKIFHKNLQDGDQAGKKQIDPNSMYCKKDWQPKSKRKQRQHFKNLQESRKYRQQLKRKQIQIYYDTSSEYTYSDSDYSFQSDGQKTQNILNLQQKQTQQQKEETQMSQIKKRKQKLFLHMKRKKLTGLEHKHKLYQDEEGFYQPRQQSEIEQESNSQGQNENKKDRNLMNAQKLQMQRQRAKYDMRLDFKNKQLQTQQWRMLQFIRSKYIQPHIEMEQTYTLYEEDQQDEYTQTQGEQYSQEKKKQAELNKK